MSAVLTGLSSYGIQVQENSMTADAAIIWSVLWSGRMAANQAIYQHYRSQNRPVIIIEVGTLHRGKTWKVAVNNITAQGYYGHLENLDWDRPGKLKISLSKQINPKPNILIALQHDRSLQVEGIDVQQWLTSTLIELKKHTDRPITIRPHPRCKTNILAQSNNVIIETPRILPNTYDSFDICYDCHALININSGPGIQAAIAGVRPIVDVSSLAYPVGVGLAEIDVVYAQDRDLWLTQLCHTEYTLDELKQGFWLNRVIAALS